MFEVYLVFASAQNFSLQPRKFDLKLFWKLMNSGVNGLSLSLCLQTRRHLILDIFINYFQANFKMPSRSYIRRAFISNDAMSGAHHNFQPAQILLLKTSQAH